MPPRRRLAASPAPKMPALAEHADPELVKLFIEEAHEELAKIRHNFPVWDENPLERDSLVTVRRSLHTLKGSGRMVGARDLGEFAWSIENLVNRVLDNTLTRSPAIIETLRAAVAVLPELITQLENGTPVRADMAGISSRAHALAAGRPSPAARSAAEDIAASGTMRAPLAEMPSAPAAAAAAPAKPAVTDDTLRDIYARETATHVATVRAYLTREAALPEPHPLPEEVYRACHTLSGSSKMAQARHGIRLAEPLDHWLRRAFSSGLGLATPDLALLGDCMSAMESVATHLDESTGYFVNHWQLLERIERADKSLDARIAAEKHAAQAQAQAAEAQAAAAAAPGVAAESAAEPEPAESEAVDFDPEVAAIFTDEATELIEASERALSDWRAQPGSAECRLGLKRPLHTLKGGARMAGIMPMGDLSHELETLVMLVDNGTVVADGPLLDAIQASLDELARMREQVANGRRVAPARQMLERLQRLAKPGAKAAPAAAAPAAKPAAPVAPAAAPAPVAAVPRAAPAPAPVPALSLSEPDPHSQSMLAKFNAELMFAGDVVAEVVAKESAARTGTALPALEITAPAVRAPVVLTPPPPAPAAPAPVAPRETPFAASSATALPFARSRLAGLSAEEDAPAAALPLVPPGREPVATSGEPKEMARVDADLLDMLLNTSGEASIARARLEQQLGSFDFNLGELSRTVTRLKEQLRSLEIETEAQILHKHEDEGSHRSEFDPLELDRYSSIQQYSRALAETANDVASIQQLLENLAKDTQNLLQQQARTITELQNGLMRTRMVPFQRHVQRLARIVRQAASDTGKRAELTVEGASGELDRQVLERMLPPFEHMLRNAVVHGIEKPDERTRRGKPDTGRILLELHREGAEVMVRLTDDGGGMNLNAIRDKAQSLGIIGAGQSPERRGCDAADPRARLLHRRRHHPAGRPRRRHGRGGHRDQAPGRRAAHGDQARRGHGVHHPPAAHPCDQPRARGAHGRGVLRAAAADRGGRAAPVQGRGDRAPGARCARSSSTPARSTASSTWRPSWGSPPRSCRGRTSPSRWCWCAPASTPPAWSPMSWSAAARSS